MDVEISAGPAFAFGEITLPAGGAVRVEAGAMAMTREGLVTDFTGPGRVWLQTRSSQDLVQWLTSKLPKDHDS